MMNLASKKWTFGVIALAQVCISCSEPEIVEPPCSPVFTVVPTHAVVDEGDTLQLGATYTDEDCMTEPVAGAAIWMSFDEDVATVSGGEVTGVASGTCQIEATYEGLTATVNVTVEPLLERIEIAPRAVTIAAHSLAAMRAVGIFSDGSKRDITDEATWTSADLHIASVDGAGQIAGAAPGTVEITASLDGLRAEPRELTVADATLAGLSIEASSPVLPVGEAMRLGATATFELANDVELTQDVSSIAIWELTGWEPAKADDDENEPALSGSGVLTGVARGTAEITATWAQGDLEKSASLTIEIQEYELTAIAIQYYGEEPPAMLRLPLAGEPAPFVVLGTYENEDGDTLTWDITKNVRWKPSGPGVALMMENVMLLLEPGTIEFEALVDDERTEDPSDKITDRIAVEVVDAPLQSIEIAPRDESASVPGVTPLVATGQFAGGLAQDLSAAVIWESGDPAYVAIDNIGSDMSVAAIIAQPAPGEQDATVTVRARYRNIEGSYEHIVPVSTVEE